MLHAASPHTSLPPAGTEKGTAAELSGQCSSCVPIIQHSSALEGMRERKLSSEPERQSFVHYTHAAYELATRTLSLRPYRTKCIKIVGRSLKWPRSDFAMTATSGLVYDGSYR
ncbi:hypothetical protein EVAR_4375_1 [Eumeta japonica]|uniref:Uncharacterized protein n=1 Tax=Eumeta variegata TaxID=151549 RepID=A0A4C1T067_EUMVA|nr:hypothetical protein EVAR_4375_1 [Eumeta japonica]